MKLLLIVLLPLIGSIPPLLVARRGRTACAWASALPTVAALILLLSLTPAILSGDVITGRWSWVPALGLDVAFLLDGYSWMFALLVLGIGLLILLYARYYLGDNDPPGRFFASLMLFMGSMTGIVLSGNLIQLVIFWELTSLSSFLLIGYWQHRSDARSGARMALTVTSMGGLALLGGVLLIGRIVGTFDLATVLDSREVIVSHPLYTPALMLVLLGAFTKSAQVPFHFWLPQAMAAPTPVSAYLHSATMVKAGVFLLGRMYPALSGTSEWFILVCAAGAATMLFGAYAALFKDDMKGLLAYSTISQLGLITLLFGFGTPYAPIAAVFHIINHATFKASLFMAAGIIEHETGTRDIRVLNGLLRKMPYTSTLAIIAAASMAGIPLLNGFLSKEMFFAEVLEVGWTGMSFWLAPVSAALAGVFSVAYSARFIHAVFIQGDGTNMPKEPHEPPRFMRVPVEVLVLLCVLVGIAPAIVVGPILVIASRAVVGGAIPPVDLAVWHGFSLPLAMSAVALSAGALMYAKRRRIRSIHDRYLPGFEAADMYKGVIARLVRLSRSITTGLENGSLQRYLAFVAGTAIAAAAVPLATSGVSRGPQPLLPVDPATAIAWAMMLAAALTTVILHRRRFTALVAMSTVGLFVALAFVRLSAPDLAVTQLLVEVVTIVLVLLALHFLPRQPLPDSSLRRRARDAVIAAIAGAGTATLAWAILTRPSNSISGYFVEQARPGAGGTNIVNVILVDFRGFDTMGEITVLAIAALGVFTMLQGLRHQDVPSAAPYALDRFPVILTQMTRVLLPYALAISIYLFLRGHNLPGGGFIAGLLTAVALVLQFLASGIRWTEDRLPIDFRTVLGVGILIAVASGAGAWLFGSPFLDQTFASVNFPLLGEVELATALIFDLGVYVTVVAAVILMLEQLGRLLVGGPEDPAYGKEASPWKP